MCSVAEIEDVEVNVKKSSKHRIKLKDKPKRWDKTEGQCMKCPEIAAVLVRNGDPLCRTCFMDYIVHKFRATIGKARVIRQGERVLLAVSGGSSSSAMLNLVVRGLSKEAPKKLRFQPGVVHIDEGELLGRTLAERKAVEEYIGQVTGDAGFPCHFITMQDLFDGKDRDTCLSEKLDSLGIFDEGSNDSSRLSELFDKVKNVTAKDDLLTHLYRWQLLKVAKEHGYDRVMVGDSSTSLSVKILSDIAQGRGSQLAFDIGFEDDRSEISILRPLREFTKKEIEFYNCFNQVLSFSIPSFSTKATSHVSVNRLTEEFIVGLQAAFPSTVSTVVRTGDKLSSSNRSAQSEHCSLCLAPLEVSSDLTNGCSEVHKQVSCRGHCVKTAKNGCCGGGNGRSCGCGDSGGHNCGGSNSSTSDGCGANCGNPTCIGDSSGCGTGGDGGNCDTSGGSHGGVCGSVGDSGDCKFGGGCDGGSCGTIDAGTCDNCTCGGSDGGGCGSVDDGGDCDTGGDGDGSGTGGDDGRYGACDDSGGCGTGGGDGTSCGTGGDDGRYGACDDSGGCGTGGGDGTSCGTGGDGGGCGNGTDFDGGGYGTGGDGVNCGTHYGSDTGDCGDCGTCADSGNCDSSDDGGGHGTSGCGTSASSACGDGNDVDHSAAGNRNGGCFNAGADGRELFCGGQHSSKGKHGYAARDIGDGLINTLCYGCRLTYNDLNDAQNLLPQYVTDNALKTLRRVAMKEQINDFLLDD